MKVNLIYTALMILLTTACGELPLEPTKVQSINPQGKVSASASFSTSATKITVQLEMTAENNVNRETMQITPLDYKRLFKSDESISDLTWQEGNNRYDSSARSYTDNKGRLVRRIRFRNTTHNIDSTIQQVTKTRLWLIGNQVVQIHMIRHKNASGDNDNYLQRVLDENVML